VSDTLVKVDIDVNADGHQSPKTTGKAHAPNGPDPLRQLFAPLLGFEVAQSSATCFKTPIPRILPCPTGFPVPAQHVNVSEATIPQFPKDKPEVMLERS
jgi:hypothetical protein